MILLVHAYILTGTVGYLTLVKPIELLFSVCCVSLYKTDLVLK